MTRVATPAPLVTAVVPSYNHERHVVAAVESVLAQDVAAPYEVIVVDDGSSDRSRELLLRHFGGDAGVRLVFQQNRGISGTFNRGLELGQGVWIAYCCSDDRWHPGHLRSALAALERRPDAWVSFGRARLVDAEGRQVEDTLFQDPADPDLLRRLLREGNSLCFPAAVFRREAALELGGFDESLQVLQDYDLWLRLLERAPHVCAEGPSVDFRWVWLGENASGRRGTDRVRRDLIRILERALERSPLLQSDTALRARVRENIVGAHRRLARRAPVAQKLAHLRAAHRHGMPLWQVGRQLLRHPPRPRARRGPAKLGVAYNAFDGLELLAASLRSVREVASFVCVVYSKTSNSGEPLPEWAQDELQAVMDSGLVDVWHEYSPDPAQSLHGNEVRKRNLGLELCAGCDTFMTMDVDEVYRPQELAGALEVFREGRFDSSACRMQTYYRRPDVVLDPPDDYYVPLFYRLDRRRFSFGKSWPVTADPTRCLAPGKLRLFERAEIQMHHLSYVRRDLGLKLRNSSARQHFEARIPQIAAYFDAWKEGKPALLAGKQDRFSATRVVEAAIPLDGWL